MQKSLEFWPVGWTKNKKIAKGKFMRPPSVCENTLNSK